MSKIVLDSSRNYKRQTGITLFYMIVFMVTYLAMVLFAIALTLICLVGAIAIVVFNPGLLTIMLAIGMIGLGIIVLSFFVKFLFKEHKVDRSGLYEIKKEDEPMLFGLLESLVQEIGTRLPRRVYLSADVNASVFYDSSFWSLFLPVRKNLIIGIGLINALTKEELRSVLAHEFGHFSQKTMRVNQYVYQFERIIHNLLYDNETHEDNVNSFAKTAGIFSLASMVALLIINVMQAILRVEYLAMKKAAMGLLREMEFHADAVEVQVSSVEAFKNALLRTRLAQSSFIAVLEFYRQLASKNQKSNNLLSDHLFAMSLLGFKPGMKMDEVRLLEDAPLQQRLNVKDPWASHPTDEERIERIEKIGKRATSTDNTPARVLFANLNRYQTIMTNKLFSNRDSNLLTEEESQMAYRDYFYSLRDPEIYRGYYQYRNPGAFNLDAPFSQADDITPEFLFSDTHIGFARQAAAVQKDIQDLEAIRARTQGIKKYNFDGATYTPKDCNRFIAELTKELELIDKLLTNNDQQIYHFFKKLEESANYPPQISSLYQRYFDFDQKTQAYSFIVKHFTKIGSDSTMAEVQNWFKAVVSAEGYFKADIRELLDLISERIPNHPKIAKMMDIYVSNNYGYLDKNGMVEKNVRMLGMVLDAYPTLLQEGWVAMKRELITYQAGLASMPR